jgi:leucyl-tRNA synthetase
MTQAAWDYVFLGKDFVEAECGGLTEDVLKKMRHEFEYWYPMDLRVSAKDLIRNHLTMSLYNHAAIWHENMEQRMTRNYFCNGYLMLNNKKMSKSDGNFMTLRQCIETYGVDASRLCMADSGDSLDDANFDEKVANASVMRLFVLEEWIQKHCPKNVDFAEKRVLNTWDKIMENELNATIEIVDKAYRGMRYKEIVKHAFNELSSMKEAYLIACNGSPNPVILLRYISTLLVLMNPICPHFC